MGVRVLGGTEGGLLEVPRGGVELADRGRRTVAVLLACDSAPLRRQVVGDGARSRDGV